MKEYIVHAPNNKLCAIEEYTSFYGEPIKELIRCKYCKNKKTCWLYYYSGMDEDGFCSLAEVEEERKEE